MCIAKFAVILVISVLIAMRAAPSSSAPVTAPWAKEPDYFRDMEHGFRLYPSSHPFR